MNGGSEGGAEISGTGRDVSEVIIMGELGHGLDVGGGPTQPLKHGPNVGSFLHGDDPELILLVHPHQECLLSIVEDASTRRPITVATTAFKKPISFPTKGETNVRIAQNN